MPHPPRSCDRLDDDHMTAEVHRRWGELVPLVAVHGQKKVREAIKIKIEQPAMNRDQGYELPPSTMNFCCHVIVVKVIT